MDEEREDYQKWKKSSDSLFSKVSRKINIFHVFLFLGLIYLSHLATISGKISPAFFMFIIISSVFILIFLFYKSSIEKKLIPEHVIKRIAYDALDRKRRNGIEIPFDCKIRVDLFSDSKYEQDLESGTTGITNRIVGFELIRKGFKKKGIMRIHPYNGEILGIWYVPIGYNIKFNKDVRIIPVGLIQERNKLSGVSIQ